MEINVNRYSKEHSFAIIGVSYIGAPQSNTAMYLSKKVGKLVFSLAGVMECLVFAENGLDVPEKIEKKHCFVFSDNPQGAYAAFTEDFFREEEAENRAIPYEHTPSGAMVSKTARIGSCVVLEPGAVVGPGVVIGDHVRILANAVVKNAIIGHHVIINENAVVGANGFTMAKNEHGDSIRIHSLGKVRIGDHVEIGVNDNVSRGSGGDTVIEDYVKIDALVHIGHDVHLHKNVEVTAGAIIGGYADIGENAYVGINAVIRNRVTLGEKSFVGMGANVTKSVEPGITVAGNPAKPFENKHQE